MFSYLLGVALTMLPDRYANGVTYGGINGAPISLEMKNTIKNTTGPEYQFSVGEGR